MITRRSRYLISVDELHGRLKDPAVRVVDVRWTLGDPGAGRTAYKEAHVPGATYLSWLDDLSDPDDPLEGQLAPPERLSSVLGEHGIGIGNEIVAYDDNAIFMAARLLWALHEYGYDRIRVLDGGWPAWCRARRRVEHGVTERSSSCAPFELRGPRGLRLTKEDVAHALRSPSTQIVDCRMEATYKAAGAHIPGAVHMPAPALFDSESGELLPENELRSMVARAGIDDERPIILYCGGGVSASAAFMALRVIGVNSARVYDGSWSEWGADPTLPKERHDHT